MNAVWRGEIAMRHDKLAAAFVVMLSTSAMAQTAKKNVPAQTPKQNAPAQTTNKNASDKTECPEAVRGADIVVQDVDGGVSLTFTTPKPKQVADLRKLVREAGTVVEHQTKLAALHPELVDKSSAKTVIPAVDIDVKDVSTGAQAMVRAEDPKQLAEVRSHAHQLEQEWDKSACVQAAKPPAGTRQSRR